MSSVTTRNKDGAGLTIGPGRLAFVISLLMVIAVTLTACGGEDVSNPTQEPPSETLLSTPAPSLSAVSWTTQLASDGTPSESLSEIPRDAIQVIAVIEVGELLPNSSFIVSWSMDGTALETLETVVEISDNTTEGWVTATLTWNGAALWPVGELGVTFVASTGETVTGSVQIISG